MKFRLVSDTHWPTRWMYDLRWYILNFSDIDYVFHMWDFDVYSTYKYFKDYFWDKLIAVYGNCDELKIKKELSEEKIIKINWINILVLHSHTIYPRGDEIKLLEKALENNVNIVFYWHTHVKKVHYFDLETNQFWYIRQSWYRLEFSELDVKRYIYFINPWSLLDDNYFVLNF